MTRSAMLLTVSLSALTAVGASHVASAIPNGLPGTNISSAIVSVEEVAAKGGMAGGMGGGMAGGGMAGGGMAGGMAGGAASGMAGGMKGVAKQGTSKQSASKKGAKSNVSGKKTNIKNTNVKNTNIKNTNIRNTNVNVNTRGAVRAWGPRPYYGRTIAGVTLGTVIVAGAVGVVPVAPDPTLCWLWSDPSMTRGYWDYCVVP